MNIVREYRKPMSDKVVLQIPERFVNTELEILIIPMEKRNTTKKRFASKKELFNKLCGLWEDRKDLTIENIRSKAWKRDLS